MREFGRDLIRGGHYGQRSCEPRQQAEHMAAPTNAAKREKALANSEPSTHRNGPQAIVCHLVANGGKADMAGEARFGSDWHQPDRARCVKTMFLHGQDP